MLRAYGARIIVEVVTMTAGPDDATADHGLLAEAIIQWFARNARDLPWRRDGFSAWGTLVSEFMLQQTPVSRVVPLLEAWLQRWPTPASLAAVPSGEAVRAWARLGYPRRALWLHACAVTITQTHGGVVPDDVDTLLALPGVGDYTARAVAAFAYGRRHPVVDTNVRRVLARALTGQAEPPPPNARRDLAQMEALLPRDEAAARALNAGAMELGAVLCTARAPRCEECPIASLCAWRSAGHPSYQGPRKAVQKRYEGSDRQARGAIMRALRTAQAPVARDELERVWSDADQLARAIAGLLADGLAVHTHGGYELP
jgi:A/G-specific adenine glycosylase